jgi:hypothetical protein
MTGVMTTMTWFVAPLFVAVALVGGCVGLPTTQSPDRPQASLSDEAILLERAKAYWEARFTQDMQRAFSFEDPVRQKRLSLIQYIRMVGEPGQLYAVAVKRVTVQDDHADVEVEMHARPPLPPWNKQPLKTTLVDDWQKIEGVWYHVLDLHMIRTGKPRVNMDHGIIEYPPVQAQPKRSGSAGSADAPAVAPDPVGPTP